MGCEGHWFRLIGLVQDPEVSESSKVVHTYEHWE